MVMFGLTVFSKIFFQWTIFGDEGWDEGLKHSCYNILSYFKYPISLYKLNSGLPQFHTPLSSTHQFHTEGPILFSPKNPSGPPTSVPHQKPLSSTHPPQFYTKNPSVPHRKPLSSTPKGALNWGVLGVELRGVFRGLKTSCSFVWDWCVELRGVWNWGRPVVNNR